MPHIELRVNNSENHDRSDWDQEFKDTVEAGWIKLRGPKSPIF